MSSFQVSLFDELTPLYPDSNPAQGSQTYRVAGANGTTVGVHLLLRGLTPGLPVTVEVQGDHRSFKLFELQALPVEVNTGAKQRSEFLKDDVNENVIRRAPFMIYEVLVPFFNILQPAYTTAAIAFKTVIEYCRKFRTRTWTLLVTQDGQTQKLVLYVDEYPLTVPKAGKDTFQYVNWFNLNAIADLHGTTKWSPKWWAMLESYMRAAVFSRQNIWSFGIGDMMELDENGKPRLLKARLDRLIKTAKTAGIAYFEGGAPTGRKLNLADDDAFYNSLDHENLTSPDEVAELYKLKAFDYFDNGREAVVGLSGETISAVCAGAGDQTLADIYSLLYDYIVENNLTDCWMQCVMDEPDDNLADVYRKMVGICKKAMPGIPVMEPTLVRESVAGTMDVWCPTLDQYEQNQDFFQERGKKGERVFVYSCLTPGANYCNRMLDMERLRQVWIGWAPIKYPQVEGFLHWGGNFYNSEGVYRRQASMLSESVLQFHPKYAMFLPAGDGAIFFAGSNMPLIGTRSEAHRIGLEDLCLLEQLKATDPEKAQEIVGLVFRGYADYEKDVSVYRKARKLILDALNK